MTLHRFYVESDTDYTTWYVIDRRGEHPTQPFNRVELAEDELDHLNWLHRNDP